MHAFAGKRNMATLAGRAHADASRIAWLAGPLLINNLATAGMTFTDTVMAGRLGALELAAVAVGANYANFFYLGALGLFMALSPLTAHAYGAARTPDVGHYFRQSWWLVATFAALTVAGMLLAQPVLLAIGIERPVAELAARYCQALAWGSPAAIGFLALRYTSEGVGWTRPMLIRAMLGLIANVLGNYAFMYGNWGAPALGAVGAAVSTAIVQWLVVISMLVYMLRHPVYRPYKLFARFEAPDAVRIGAILRIGTPIAGSVLAEGALFSSAGLMMGTLGAGPMAAHAIAINYASLMFMVPLSVHSATTIHVGHALGRGDHAAARFAGWVGIALCVAVMAFSAAFLLVARGAIADLYTDDLVVMQFAAHLLIFAAAFQLADGLQVGALGALRGFKDTRVPLAINLFGYWLVGFPVAYYVGVVRGVGADAIWSGLILGLLVCAVLLAWRYVWLTQVRPLEAARKAQ
jgi:MATE family multidrug resistance protein